MHAVTVDTGDPTSNGAGKHRRRITSCSVRLAPPLAHDDRVARERLTRRLVGSRERLVLIVAPAGYGKTALAVQWSELDDRRFAWVALGAGTGDPEALWGSIAESVARAEPAFAPTAERVASWLASAEPSTMAAQVAEAFEAIDPGLVIVLDDFHLLADSASHASIASFLGLMPAGIQLVVVSRCDPPLTVARLRASGDLLELRADELALRVDEVDALMNATLQLDLAPDAVALLHDRTEGWPAIVALAGRSLRDRDDRDHFLEDFDGSNRFVVDYLAEVVLDGLDSDRRSFLLDTSILERMSGDLCDAVLERDGSTRLLCRAREGGSFPPSARRTRRVVPLSLDRPGVLPPRVDARRSRACAGAQAPRLRLARGRGPRRRGLPPGTCGAGVRPGGQNRVRELAVARRAGGAGDDARLDRRVPQGRSSSRRTALRRPRLAAPARRRSPRVAARNPGRSRGRVVGPASGWSSFCRGCDQPSPGQLRRRRRCRAAASGAARPRARG